MLGNIEGWRRREHQQMRWLDSITDSMDMNLRKLQETVEDRGSGHAAIHGVTESDTTQQLNNNKKMKTTLLIISTLCKNFDTQQAPHFLFLSLLRYGQAFLSFSSFIKTYNHFRILESIFQVAQKPWKKFHRSR